MWIKDLDVIKNHFERMNYKELKSRYIIISI